MPFPVKDWRDYPDTSTPRTAAAMEDIEQRIQNAVAPQMPALAAPFSPEGMTGASAAVDVNGGLFTRVTVPRTGTLRDFTIWVGTSSGNCKALVYDTGDASVGNRTLLYSSGSVAVGAGNSYQVVADPSLAVTAGQQLDLILAVDNTTAAFGRRGGVPATTVAQLPTSFWPAAGGASPKLFGKVLAVFTTPPATISEANMSATTTVQTWIGCRVS